MSSLKKSAIWALVSVPITFVGSNSSFAMAHGATFLIVLLYPGLATEYLVFENENTEQVLGPIGFIAQYIAYFGIIYLIYVLRRTTKNKESI